MAYVSLTVNAFHLKRLLLLDRRIVVQLCTLNERVGYLDSSEIGRSRWVWLTEDRLALIRDYVGQPFPASEREPDLVLGLWGASEDGIRSARDQYPAARLSRNN